MKLQLLNSILNSNSVYTASFIFDPIALPISKIGYIVPEDNADNKHYATIVFIKELDNFYIFEFDQNILDGLGAYRARHGGISKFEVLLSRRADSKLQMTIGSHNFINYEDLVARSEQIRDIYNKLYSAYKEKQEYVVFEMKDRR